MPTTTDAVPDSSSASANHRAASAEGIHPRLKRGAFGENDVALGLFLSMLDSSIVSTSLFTIAVEFKEVDNINWVALAYTLTFLSCAVLFARISDVVGRRAAFVAAYVVFIAFSLACGFAKGMNQLIAFRALQGLGGSGLYSISMIIMPEVTPDRAKKYISGVVGMVLASSGVLGPVVGGLLTQYASWRWVFWINGPVGGVSLLVFLLAWPNKQYLPSLQRRTWKDVDFVGAFLLISSAVLIVFPFQNAASNPTWSSAIFLAPLLTGIAAFAGLFAWQLYLERRGVNLASALPLVLIRNRTYAAAVAHTLLIGFPYLLCIYAFPVRFQVVYGKSARDAGLMLLPMLAATALGTVGAGVVSGAADKKARFFETLMAACVLMLLGCGLEIMAGSEGKVEAKVLGFLVFIGLGFGLSAAAGTMTAAVEAPVFEHASAQGIMAQVRIFGGSIGIAASSAILGSKSRAQLATGALPAEAFTHLAANPAALSPGQWAAIRQVYTDALKEDMIVCCAVLAAAMVVTLGAYRKNRVSMEEMIKQRYIEEAKRRRSVRLSQMGVITGAAVTGVAAAGVAAAVLCRFPLSLSCQPHLGFSSLSRVPFPPTITKITTTTPSPLTTPFSPPPPKRTMSTSTLPPSAAARLEGKTILITGASSGIGRSCALEFARAAPRDLRLILTARREERLQELKEEIRKEVGEGVKVLVRALDVADKDAVRGFVGGLEEGFKGVDVLVNNAGLVKGVARAPGIAEEDIDVMFQTNVTGLINMTQAVLPIFKARPDGGAGDIINIGSIAGREPYAGGSIYCATKAAVRAFTDALRKELIDTRIRVMEVDPGQVETLGVLMRLGFVVQEFSVVRFYGDKSKADAVYDGCDPLTPDDIAEVVVFVASRRQNVVVADTLIFPSHQAGAGVLHRKS
ncbi:hypothetical protein C8A05DRAFT_42045 [Staphylotrichum tortipilum]|uniref:Major facilitator superfamily (MFS) profile domain-containing protein n=1 Tax=Staphylotrichum tortipilum TaxID=2831512 RepID=A0AAN6MR70_9PEZI|nr:hypothetical protein C8A05DRAFT_42045 [Staphylotrichum longicolle]